MKIIFYILFISLIISESKGQELYIKTFGNPNDKPIIFLHGGPGYNSVNFEYSTAEKLSANGFFVIVYDRRGEGRSTAKDVKYNFEQTFADINNIYSKYKLAKSNLIGHSFGGIVATLFAKSFPEQISSVILVGAPVSLQETFKTIISKSRSIYISKSDSINLNYIKMLEKLDTNSLMYSSYCFMHAMQNNFYSPKILSEQSKNILTKIKSDTAVAKLASNMTFQAPKGFWENEKYTTINLTETINLLVESKIKIYGIYGKEDGLYSEEQVMSLSNLIGPDNLRYLSNCSHNAFIDRQDEFVELLDLWINSKTIYKQRD